MKSKLTSILAGLCVSSVLLTTTAAFAQTPGGGKANAKEKKEGEGYGYEFGDDPLSAGGFGPNDATIRVRPGAVTYTAYDAEGRRIGPVEPPHARARPTDDPPPDEPHIVG